MPLSNFIPAKDIAWFRQYILKFSKEKKYFSELGSDMRGSVKRKINFPKIELKSSSQSLVGSGVHFDRAQLPIKIEIIIFWRCGRPVTPSAKSQMSLN